MRYVIFVLLISFLTSITASEKADAMLFGDVKSSSTGEHIPYASIIVKGTKMGTASDGTGHFKLANLPLGKQIIIVKAMGYKACEKEVIMERNQAKELFFVLEEDVISGEEVVVTGTRTEHYIKNAPARTEVLTDKEIENKNAGTLYEALDNTPGIRVENQCQYCNFTMVRMQGLGSEHTQVLINGQPIYSGLASVYGLNQIETADIEQIEIVKGAGSAIYGSGAVAGAINIITKEPSYVPMMYFHVQMGSYGTNRFHIYSTMRNETGNMGLNIFAGKQTGDAIDETKEGKTEAEVEGKDGVSDRVEFDLTNMGIGFFREGLISQCDHLELKAKTIFETREGGVLSDDYYKNPLTDGTENITTKRYEGNVNYILPMFNIVKLTYSLAFSYHDRKATNDSYLGDYMDTHDGAMPDLREMRPYLAEENTLTTSLTLNQEFRNHNLLGGFQFFFSDLEESGMYVVVNPESSFLGSSYKSMSSKNAREIGVFVQDEWNPVSSLIIAPSMRLDHHSSEEEYKSDRKVFEKNSFPKADFDETSFNPRLALKYNLSHKVTLRLNGGTGYRAPYGFSEDLHLCSGSPRVWKSNELNPEKSISVNISGDYYGETIKMSLNFFRTNLKDKIGFVDASSDVSAMGYDYEWKNIDDAFVQGIELTFFKRVTRNLSLNADFTYNQGEYDNVREDWAGTEFEDISKKISRFPETSGNFKLEYKYGSWQTFFSVNYQGKMYIDYYNEEIVPEIGDKSKIKETESVILFNGRISKKVKQFEIYGGVNNLFNVVQDEKYLDDAAFMYAPVYGAMYYGGIKMSISH